MLFSRHRGLFTSLEIVFFDTTSIYFEGEGGYESGRRGNSKDHRPDRKQLVVGAILDNSGNPVSCEIWPGNTTDVKTLVPIVKRLRKHFNIGARMRSQNEVKNEVLSRGGRYQEVTFTRTSGSKEKKANLKVKEVLVGKTRYIVSSNETQAKKDAADRKAIIEALESQLKQGAKSFVGNKGFRKYLKNPDNKFEIDSSKIESEARYDGKWVLRTNTDLKSGDVALRYKELRMVEHIFRSIKSVVESGQKQKGVPVKYLKLSESRFHKRLSKLNDYKKPGKLNL